MTLLTYGEAILSAFEYLLEKYPQCFVIGQGLWSPWYVGNTMTGLDKKFGESRIIDTPVSEAACTGAAIGASLAGAMPIMVHPRMDFMLYAMDPIVNQAAKWSYMFGGASHPGVTIRAIVNRGGEQGAQHSQALHSWFAHVPGLRVVMPASVQDARDLLIASVICPDPVIYIDDRWLYDSTDDVPPIQELSLSNVIPSCISQGDDITIVAIGHSVKLATQSLDLLKNHNISPDIFDVRVLTPFNCEGIVNSVKRTSKLVVIDGAWSTCGFASEVITSVVENLHPSDFSAPPMRITLPNVPAPTASNLEDCYYLSVDTIISRILSFF